MNDKILDRSSYTYLNVRKIPKKVKVEFRQSCRNAGHSMEDVCAALLDKYARKPEIFKVQPTPGTREKDSFIFLRNVPRALKAKFKSVCMLREDTVEDVMYTLLLSYLKRPELFKVRKAGRDKVWERPYKEYV